jgi:hypothetical protein
MGTPGPYENAGNLYWVVLEQPSNLSLNLNVVAYKSTDGGITFTRFPELTFTNGGGTMCVSYPGTGTLIYMAWRGTESGFQHGDLHTATFDMATDTFSVANDPGVTISTGSNNGIFIEHLPSGDTIIVWVHNVAGTHEVLARVYDGVSWSSDITIFSDASANATLWVVVVDGDGNTGVFWQSGSVISYTIIAGGVAGSPVTALADTTNFTSTQFPESAIYDANSNSVAWVITQRVGLAPMDLQVIIGTPANAPVFSLNTVATDTGNDLQWSTPSLASNAAGTAFYIVTEVTGGGEVDKVYHEFSAATLAGSWTGPTIFYDQTLNPPSPPPIAPELYPTWAKVLSNGDLVVTTGDIYAVFGPSFCGVLLYLAPTPTPPPAQTLELTKIVSGGTASPTDFLLSAVGGSPETDISGAGHVGPTEVSPGIYELSETSTSSPSWGDATWGVDLWGGDYSPQPWDCGGAEMPTPTSVVVPEGGTVACSITNVFVPTPPPPGPGNGQANPVGCFELLRVDVTLMPSRHLPTRGSVR